MKFSIITPTHKREKELERALMSVLSQDHPDWEMIIINDSPEISYDFISKIDDERIRYFVNDENKGVNFSRNRALSLVSKDSDYVIFLDDDDWLAVGALVKLSNILKKHSHEWMVANRETYEMSLTQVHKDKIRYTYFYDVLLSKNIQGDMTHIIRRDIAQAAHFPYFVKQGEEWYYFLTLPPGHFAYYNIKITETDGYLPGGLTEVLRDKYKENTSLLMQEESTGKVSFIIFLRKVKIFFTELFSIFSQREPQETSLPKS
jgi:glycosyltransferase involved in cell wall biosynthesis